MASVEIWNATQAVDVVPENILRKCHAFIFYKQILWTMYTKLLMLPSVVAMKDGRVHSFDLENTEEKAPSGFTSFLTQQLGMLISTSFTSGLSHFVPVTTNSFYFFSDAGNNCVVCDQRS